MRLCEIEKGKENRIKRKKKKKLSALLMICRHLKESDERHERREEREELPSLILRVFSKVDGITRGFQQIHRQLAGGSNGRMK